MNAEPLKYNADIANSYADGLMGVWAIRDAISLVGQNRSNGKFWSRSLSVTYFVSAQSWQVLELATRSVERHELFFSLYASTLAEMETELSWMRSKALRASSQPQNHS
eukprot:3742124-Amphidinium_carterae.1